MAETETKRELRLVWTPVGCPRCGATLPGFVRLMPREGLSNEELTRTERFLAGVMVCRN